MTDIENMSKNSNYTYMKKFKQFYQMNELSYFI